MYFIKGSQQELNYLDLNNYVAYNMGKKIKMHLKNIKSKNS